MGRIPPPPPRPFVPLDEGDPGPIELEATWKDSDTMVSLAIAAVALAALIFIVYGMMLITRHEPGYEDCMRNAQDSYIQNDGIPSESWNYARIVCRDLR